MPTYNSRGLRGSALEEMINLSNDKYLDSHLALIQKIPTPITPIDIDHNTKQVTLAYFDKKSTVDYIGAVQGIPVCFDAKECKEDTFTLHNIHDHQVEFMKEFERQGGIAFFLLYYTKRDVFHYLKLDTFLNFYERANSGGRKSFRFDELEEVYFFKSKNGILVPYLDKLNLDLQSR